MGYVEDSGLGFADLALASSLKTLHNSKFCLRFCLDRIYWICSILFLLFSLSRRKGKGQSTRGRRLLLELEQN